MGTALSLRGWAPLLPDERGNWRPPRERSARGSIAGAPRRERALQRACTVPARPGPARGPAGPSARRSGARRPGPRPRPRPVDRRCRVAAACMMCKAARTTTLYTRRQADSAGQRRCQRRDKKGRHVSRVRGDLCDSSETLKQKDLARPAPGWPGRGARSNEGFRRAACCSDQIYSCSP